MAAYAAGCVAALTGRAAFSRTLPLAVVVVTEVAVVEVDCVAVVVFWLVVVVTCDVVCVVVPCDVVGWLLLQAAAIIDIMVIKPTKIYPIFPLILFPF
jgi:hypothetical protein